MIIQTWCCWKVLQVQQDSRKSHVFINKNEKHNHKQAFVMHYNAARFYTELKDKSLARFGIAVSSSFGIASIMYISIASLGFLTFGANSAGYILNNYSPYDPLATGSRLCVGLAVLVSFTLHYPILLLKNNTSSFEPHKDVHSFFPLLVVSPMP
jgi:Transmembrane amino acid transporter protein